jgi:hypothetical protein
MITHHEGNMLTHHVGIDSNYSVEHCAATFAAPVHCLLWSLWTLDMPHQKRPLNHPCSLPAALPPGVFEGHVVHAPVEEEHEHAVAECADAQGPGPRCQFGAWLQPA